MSTIVAPIAHVREAQSIPNRLSREYRPAPIAVTANATAASTSGNSKPPSDTQRPFFQWTAAIVTSSRPHESLCKPLAQRQMSRQSLRRLPQLRERSLLDLPYPFRADAEALAYVD